MRSMLWAYSAAAHQLGLRITKTQRPLRLELFEHERAGAVGVT